jgi:hypothetical protein
MPGYCPAPLPLPRSDLWKTFRSKPNTIPVEDKKCSPSHRNAVRLQNGMLFGITTESCSASGRNRVHLRPDSPLIPHTGREVRCVSLDRPQAVCWGRPLTFFLSRTNWQEMISTVSIYTSITYNPLVLLLFRFQKPEKQP